jgi:hypothetical protein
MKLIKCNFSIYKKLARWTWESHDDYGNITTVLHTMEQTIAANLHLRLLHSPKDKKGSGQAPVVATPATPRSHYAKLSAREGFVKLLAVHDILINCPIVPSSLPLASYLLVAHANAHTRARTHTGYHDHSGQTVRVRSAGGAAR